MRVEAAGSTHVGMKRTGNEDSLLILDEEHLYVVADGMGGHASGEVASGMAVAELEAFFRLTGDDRELTWPFKMDADRGYEENRLLVGIRQANARICDQARRESRYKGMGTTIASLHFFDDRACIGWAGDSRVYRFRGGDLVQLSEDHSLLNDLIRAKKLSPEEIEAFPHKNVIVRALGIQDNLQVDILQERPQDGDLYLLCSDGLSGMLSDERIAALLREEGEDEEKVARLIDAANEAGGIDNVTVVLARWFAA